MFCGECAWAGDHPSNPEPFLYKGDKIVIVLFHGPAIGDFQYDTTGIPSTLISVNCLGPSDPSGRSPSDVTNEVFGFLV